MGNDNTKSRQRTGLAVLVVCAILVGTVGPVLADATIFVADASVETDHALAGEPTNVTFELRNTGDAGGASRIDILVNGSTEISERYNVESGGGRTITEQLTFEQPGTYNITVNRRHAGNVTVSRTVIETTDDRSDGRTMLLRAKRIPYDSRVTAEFPASNDTFVVESLRMQSTRNEFTRNVETYTVPENAPFDVPDESGTTLVGAATIESVSGVDDQRIRIGVNRSTLTDSGLSSDEVSIYRRTDDGLERLETEQIAERNSRYIYEIQASDATQFVVGTVAPRFEVSGHSLSATNVGDEKRIVVSANVTNTGGINGNYTATLLIDNDAVNNKTVELAAGEGTEVTLSHRITEDGSYNVALDEQSVGTVVLSSGSGDDETTATPTDTPNDEPTDEQSTDQGTTDQQTTAPSQSTESPTESRAATTDDSDDGSAGIPLPGSDDVGLTEIAIGVGVAIIGIILVLLQRW